MQLFLSLKILVELDFSKQNVALKLSFVTVDKTSATIENVEIQYNELLDENLP